MSNATTPIPHDPGNLNQNQNQLAVSVFLLPILLKSLLTLALLYFSNILRKKTLSAYYLRRLPLVNGRPFFGLGSARESKRVFHTNARGLLREGFAKAKDGAVFRVETDDVQVVVLSPEFANEIRNDARFSFTDLISEECLSHIPPFRNFNPHAGLNDIAKDVLQKRLTPSLGLVTLVISEEATQAFKEHWTDSTNWHALDAQATLVQIIARVSSRVFLGPELCRDPAWLRVTVGYTLTVFRGVMALKAWPSLLQPLVWRFVPEVKRVSAQIEEAVGIIGGVVEGRGRSAAKLRKGSGMRGKGEGEGDQPRLDVMQWATEVANGRRYDPTLLQLGFSMASMHNTTDLVTQVLYDLCAHPEYIAPLRKEIETVLESEGMTKSGLASLKLMDSFMKESQRLKPSELLGMRRVLIEDVTLSNGIFLPRGTQVGIPTTTTPLRTQDPISDPTSFDGYRFTKMVSDPDPQKEKTRHFVSTSPEYLGFGYGKHACPGRFFASHEVKIILCHVLLHYDFKFAGADADVNKEVDVKPPAVLDMGWASIAQPGVKLMVRRRENVDELLLHR
ncbi:cytochrome P450 [Astrocystis sublimbata]|nr:cytochrome P450 [Astrocystis sublimbata]